MSSMSNVRCISMCLMVRIVWLNFCMVSGKNELLNICSLFLLPALLLLFPVLRTLLGHKANICSLDFHPFGSFVASGSLDTNIKLWDVRRKGCVFRYKGHTEAVRCLRFSPDGKWLASAADDHTVKVIYCDTLLMCSCHTGMLGSSFYKALPALAYKHH